MTRHALLASAASALVCLAGCDDGPDVAPVTGVVTQNGEPLAHVIVEFQPDKGAPSYGETDETGSYKLMYQTNREGALLGHHWVSVRTPDEVTDPRTDTTVKVRETVPVQYNDETELEYEVVKGKNNFDIKIEGERRGGRRR
jgi:hypothetical protein